MKNYHLGGLVAFLQRSEAAFHTRRLKSTHINYGQFTFLMTLYFEDGINQETIARRLFLNKATVARSIEKLEREGYVYRVQDEKDGRANRVFLAPKARELEPEITRAVEEWNGVLIAGLTDVETLVAKELLKKMVANAFHEMGEDDLVLPAGMKE